MSNGRSTSILELHKLWAGLEDEHHQLAIALERAGIGGADVTLLRDRQTKLLLDINAVVAAIREAPTSTFEDHLALLDVALEHEVDLAADIAFYGPADFPMITRLLRALAERAPGFEFNSLRRWLSGPGQFEQVTGRPPFIHCPIHETAVVGPSSGCRTSGQTNSWSITSRTLQPTDAD